MVLDTNDKTWDELIFETTIWTIWTIFTIWTPPKLKTTDFAVATYAKLLLIA